MSDYYSNNNYDSYNNQYDSNYQYDSNGYSQYEASMDEEAPIVMKVKTVFAEEVIAKSFLFMFIALLITAFASLTTTMEVAINMLFGYNFMILMAVEIGIVLFSEWAIRKNHAVLAGVLYVAYSYLTGVTLSVIFMLYTTASIISVFLITAGLFAVMAVYGLVTKKDLSSAGSLMTMGLLGIIITGLVNIFFLQSTVLDTVICCIGVLIFVGLTAYDTQKIKQRVEMSNDDNVLTLALYGGFELYLDFVNLFLKLLSIFGKSRD